MPPSVAPPPLSNLCLLHIALQNCFSRLEPYCQFPGISVFKCLFEWRGYGERAGEEAGLVRVITLHIQSPVIHCGTDCDCFLAVVSAITSFSGLL